MLVLGSIKLPLLSIGKSKRPRCFKNTYMDSLPVIYRNQKNAWVNTEIFSSLFYDQFVPYVQRKLKSKSLPPKALLILDNCSAHPEEGILVSDDGLVIAKCFSSKCDFFNSTDGSRCAQVYEKVIQEIPPSTCFAFC